MRSYFELNFHAVSWIVGVDVVEGSCFLRESRWRSGTRWRTRCWPRRWRGSGTTRWTCTTRTAPSCRTSSTTSDQARLLLLHYYRRKRSCGKVMFSQVSVILVRGVGNIKFNMGKSHGRGTPWISYLGTYPFAGQQSSGTNPLLVTSGGDHWRLVHLGTYPLGVTSGDGHWNWKQ